MTDYGHELEFGYFLIPDRRGRGFLNAAEAMGAPARTPGQSLEPLEEAIVILGACWSASGVLQFHGRYYELEGARPGPKSAHRSVSGSVPPARASEAQQAIDGGARGRPRTGWDRAHLQRARRF